MNMLQVRDLYKQVRNLPVLNNINVDIKPLQKVAIAGETGSGKSTLLRIIAGWEQAGSGEVWYNGQKVLGPEDKLLPGHPQIAYLSQQFELPNNYIISEVLDFENKLGNEEAAHLYNLCHINHLLGRKTNQLSGGEKQRTAIARLLIRQPGLLLLDEPFSNLDPIHKRLLKSILHSITHQLQISCILVSHDPVDTLSWADELIVLKDGQIVQQADPKAIYYFPENEYVAGLFGPYNLLAGKIRPAAQLSFLQQKDKRQLVRPEQLIIRRQAKQSALAARVVAVHFTGSYYEIEIEHEGALLLAISADGDFEPGQLVYAEVKTAAVHYL